MIRFYSSIILYLMFTQSLVQAHDHANQGHENQGHANQGHALNHVDTINKVVSLKSLQVTETLPALKSDTTDLKFNEVFKMPVGPRGLEPSQKLVTLNYKQVRMVGYVAKQATPTPGLFILTPLPVIMSDEDDQFADDMPANSIFVHLDNADLLAQHANGLIEVTGMLSVGNVNEVDGRISYVRIKLDKKLNAGVANNQ